MSPQAARLARPGYPSSSASSVTRLRTRPTRSNTVAEEGFHREQVLCRLPERRLLPESSALARRHWLLRPARRWERLTTGTGQSLPSPQHARADSTRAVQNVFVPVDSPDSRASPI